MSSPKLPNDQPVDLLPPDITPYAEGNCGLPYTWRFEAETPGPDVLVTAVVHGNEPCGAVALDWLLSSDVRPIKGALTLAFMNYEACLAFDPDEPTTTRWVDEDFNRVWAGEVLASDRDSVEMRRAREMQPVVARADYLLDIHSMTAPSPPMMMAGWQTKGRELAHLVGVPELVVMDRGHAAGRRMRDHGRFAEAGVPGAALLVECGQHWDLAAGDLAIEATLRFLTGLGAIAPDWLEGLGAPDPAPQSTWEVTDPVTIQSETFTFVRPFQGGEVLAEAGTLIGHDGPDAVRTPYDDCMLVMPSPRLKQGLTAVRLARRLG
ncbi:MAG: succinylglutamate desuccinylase/aspartoacylase family protein [Pseudomonadota bacterium]